MQNTDHLSKEELRKQLFKLSPEATEDFRKSSRADTDLLCLNFQEMGKRGEELDIGNPSAFAEEPCDKG